MAGQALLPGVRTAVAVAVAVAAVAGAGLGVGVLTVPAAAGSAPAAPNRAVRPAPVAAAAAPDASLVVTVPPIAVGRSDGLPERLLAGRSYETAIPVLATVGVHGARATVSVGGRVLDGCDRVRLRPGVGTLLRCQLTGGGGGPLTVRLVVTAPHTATTTADYLHP